MAGYSTFPALVLREAKYKESDRIVTLLSAEHGLLTAKAQGALRKTSKLGASTQQLTYSEITVYENAGKIRIREASVLEPFTGLRTDFSNYALACYFADCVDRLISEDEANEQVLQLTLNCLYALSNALHDPLKIKAAFELRLMCILGYEPDLSRCSVCAKEMPEEPTFGFTSGHICCRSCRNADIGITDYLCPESLKAMRHICLSRPKQILSFDLSKEAQRRLSIACEDYLLRQTDRRFATLDYWKKVRI